MNETQTQTCSAMMSWLDLDFRWIQSAEDSSYQSPQVYHTGSLQWNLESWKSGRHKECVLVSERLACYNIILIKSQIGVRNQWSFPMRHTAPIVAPY